MAEIKAFVAHSFSADDKDMIQIFIDHFQSLAGSLPGFSWDHALQAEPTSVSGKVLAKIEDKNVFIGICSRTEYVMPPTAAHPIPILDQVRVRNSDIQWKTSDWIIQEIGLAVGRGGFGKVEDRSRRALPDRRKPVDFQNRVAARLPRGQRVHPRVQMLDRQDTSRGSRSNLS
jgi:hypothetical protein